MVSLAAAAATLVAPSLRLRQQAAVAAPVRVTQPAGQSAASAAAAREELRGEDARAVMGDGRAEEEEGAAAVDEVDAAAVASGSRRSRNREETSMPSSRRS